MEGGECFATCVVPRLAGCTDERACWEEPAGDCDRRHKDHPGGAEEQGVGGKEAMAMASLNQR